MTLSARAIRIWAVAIGGMGLLDALHVFVAAHITAGNSRATTGWVGFSMAHPTVLAAPVMAYAFAWYRFVRRTDQLAWGAAAFALLWLVVRVWTTAYATGHQDFIQGGATMLGWILGALWGRALVPGGAANEAGSPGAAGRQLEIDRYAATGALALFAATYVCAGTSKLVNSDMEWTGAVTIRLMAISHLRVDDVSLLAGMKRWLAHDPYAGTVLQHATVVIQTGAFVALFGKWPRAVWCSLLALLHLGIYLSSGIVFLTPAVLAVVFAIPWDRRGGAGEPAAPSPISPRDGDPAASRARLLLPAALGVTGLLLALVWLTPLGPALRFQVLPWRVAHSPGRGTGTLGAGSGSAAAPLDTAEPAPPPAGPAARALLGDLPEGASLTGCILRGISGPADRRVTLRFDCPGGAATLWLLRKGSTPYVPPASTERLDVLTKKNGEGPAATPAELTALVAAVTARILATGERGDLPAGL